ncbi:methyltransferase [Neorickettsia helminthoeca]|uniref:methyltransferase n=1 Tax=Neorickettsia helminthoeca TaxID=33994 RepID=UPI00056E04BB|nr:methyltransferase [Neorickettsia helminthoeca]
MFSSFLNSLSQIVKDIYNLFLSFFSLFKGKEEVYDTIKEGLKTSSNFREFYKNNLSLGLYHFHKGNITDAKFRFRILNAIYKDKPLPAYNLARCLLLSGDKDKAKVTFEDILSKNSKDYEEVKFFLNFISGQPISRIPIFIVKEKFEYLAQDYVEKFLIGKQYVGHKLIFEGLRAILGEALMSSSILDLGCGTGVCAHFLKLSGVVGNTCGVDISENMLEIAKRCLADGKAVFDSISQENIGSFLSSNKDKYDLIIAADSFTYLGDLQDVIPQCVDALNDDGVLVVLVRSHKQEGIDYIFDLHKTAFSYSFEYMNNLAKGLDIKSHVVRKCTFKSACEGIIAFYIKNSSVES